MSLLLILAIFLFVSIFFIGALYSPPEAVIAGFLGILILQHDKLTMNEQIIAAVVIFITTLFLYVVHRDLLKT